MSVSAVRRLQSVRSELQGGAPEPRFVDIDDPERGFSLADFVEAANQTNLGGRLTVNFTLSNRTLRSYRPEIELQLGDFTYELKGSELTRGGWIIATPFEAAIQACNIARLLGIHNTAVGTNIRIPPAADD